MANKDSRRHLWPHALMLATLSTWMSSSAHAQERVITHIQGNTHTTASIGSHFSIIDQLDMAHWLPYVLLLLLLIPVMWTKSAGFASRVSRIVFRTFALLVLLIPLKSTMSPIFISLAFSLPIHTADFVLYVYSAPLIMLGVFWTDQQKRFALSKVSDSLKRSHTT